MRGQNMAGLQGLILMAGYWKHVDKTPSTIKRWKLFVR